MTGTIDYRQRPGVQESANQQFKIPRGQYLLGLEHIAIDIVHSHSLSHGYHCRYVAFCGLNGDCQNKIEGSLIVNSSKRLVVGRRITVPYITPAEAITIPTMEVVAACQWSASADQLHVNEFA